MDWLIGGLLVLLLLNIALTFWLLFKSGKSSNDQLGVLEKELVALKSEILKGQLESLVRFQQSLESSHGTINDRLADSSEALDKRLSVISEIENKLGVLSGQSERLDKISGNIKSLTDVLKPPKHRGRMGEILLENLLKDIFPDKLLTFQYAFSDGKRVDAAVEIAGRILPIDSKFPLDAFQRLIDSHDDEVLKEAAARDFKQSIKKHISSISEKYIRPQENSFDFALMYIPSEAVYNYFIGEDCEKEFRLALKSKVIPSSPGHLYGFMLSITVLATRLGFSGGSDKIAGLISRLDKLTEDNMAINIRLGGSLRSAGQSLDKSNNLLKDVDNMIKELKELSF